MNLSQITFEDDGSLKNKLIMKVQTDQQNSNLIVLPDNITSEYNKIKHNKDQRYQLYVKAKEELNLTMKQNNEVKERVANIKDKIGQIERTDVIGLKKKLLKLQKQNKMLRSSLKQ